jgi:thiol-disulfide isomerase/thioredoxin
VNGLDCIEKFEQHLQQNQSVILLKFEAEWCGPCKKLEPSFIELINKYKSIIHEVIKIDVDECFEVYAFMKNKKMLNGIPAVLAYFKGNISYIPNESTVGSNVNELEQFFERCKNYKV